MSTEDETRDKEGRCASEFWSDPLQKSETPWAVVYIIGTLWLFLGIAHVSEDYFAESISRIIVEYKIPASVAGATLMAAGSSSPEIIAEMVGVILGDTDTSTGTVIGSAVFNQLFIIGAAILVSPRQVMVLDWRSQSRDMAAYAVTIAIMVAFFWDGKIVWYEACLMVSAYVGYVLVCTYWETIEGALCSTAVEKPPKDRLASIGHTSRPDGYSVASIGGLSLKPPQEPAIQSAIPRLSEALLGNTDGPLTDPDNSAVNRRRSESTGSMASSRSISRRQIDGDHGAVHSPKERWDELKSSGSLLKKAQFLAELPFAVSMFWTLGKLQQRRYSLMVFFGSLMWLTLLVTFMIVWLTKSGCLLGISPTAMGLTFGAAGTSMPDCLVSLHVSRRGEGNMAVSNVFGSNIFDILLALGLPWVVSIMLIGESKEIKVDGSEILTAVMVMAFLFFLFNLLISGFRQSAGIGYVYLVLYAAFFCYCFTF